MLSGKMDRGDSEETALLGVCSWYNFLEEVTQ